MFPETAEIISRRWKKTQTNEVEQQNLNQKKKEIKMKNKMKKAQTNEADGAELWQSCFTVFSSSQLSNLSHPCFTPHISLTLWLMLISLILFPDVLNSLFLGIDFPVRHIPIFQHSYQILNNWYISLILLVSHLLFPFSSLMSSLKVSFPSHPNFTPNESLPQRQIHIYLFFVFHVLLLYFIISLSHLSTLPTPYFTPNLSTAQ